MSDKKKKQLGMNPGTAQHRLLKDILWDLVVKTENDHCFHCGEKMERDNFSIEHIEPWLDSENPLEKFFDINNISFSHLKCNVEKARNYKKPCGNNASYNRGCRCDYCKEAHKNRARNDYTYEKRRKKYLSKGY